jgi:hypothetical protein
MSTPETLGELTMVDLYLEPPPARASTQNISIAARSNGRTQQNENTALVAVIGYALRNYCTARRLQPITAAHETEIVTKFVTGYNRLQLNERARCDERITALYNALDVDRTIKRRMIEAFNIADFGDVFMEAKPTKAHIQHAIDASNHNPNPNRQNKRTPAEQFATLYSSFKKSLSKCRAPVGKWDAHKQQFAEQQHRTGIANIRAHIDGLVDGIADIIETRRKRLAEYRTKINTLTMLRMQWPDDNPRVVLAHEQAATYRNLHAIFNVDDAMSLLLDGLYNGLIGEKLELRENKMLSRRSDLLEGLITFRAIAMTCKAGWESDAVRRTMHRLRLVDDKECLSLGFREVIAPGAVDAKGVPIPVPDTNTLPHIPAVCEGGEGGGKPAIVRLHRCTSITLTVMSDIAFGRAVALHRPHIDRPTIDLERENAKAASDDRAARIAKARTYERDIAAARFGHQLDRARALVEEMETWVAEVNGRDEANRSLVLRRTAGIAFRATVIDVRTSVAVPGLRCHVFGRPNDPLTAHLNMNRHATLRFCISADTVEASNLAYKGGAVYAVRFAPEEVPHPSFMTVTTKPFAIRNDRLGGGKGNSTHEQIAAFNQNKRQKRAAKR